MPLDAAQLSDLIGEIYECAFDPARWEPTLARLAHTVGACNGTLLRHGEMGAAFSYSWGVPDEVQRQYVERYERINPLATVGWHGDVGQPVSLSRFMTEAELRATRFYREFLAPLGWLDFLLVALERTANDYATISFTRTEAAGPPGTDAIATMAMLSPHVRRAARLHGLLRETAARENDLASAFDALALPVLLLDSDGRCIDANAAGKRAIAADAVLRHADGLVSVRIGGGRADPLRPAAQEGVVQPASMALRDGAGRQHVAHLVPLRAEAGLGRAAAAVFIQEVGAQQPLPGAVLVQLYGLTPAETRLIGLLARGHTLEAAADALGIALSTARTHLARIFHKTGTSRQAELVRLVMSAMPG